MSHHRAHRPCKAQPARHTSSKFDPTTGAWDKGRGTSCYDQTEKSFNVTCCKLYAAVIADFFQVNQLNVMLQRFSSLVHFATLKKKWISVSSGNTKF